MLAIWSKNSHFFVGRDKCAGKEMIQECQQVKQAALHQRRKKHLGKKDTKKEEDSPGEERPSILKCTTN